jgi:hypothetical protein
MNDDGIVTFCELVFNKGFNLVGGVQHAATFVNNVIKKSPNLDTYVIPIVWLCCCQKERFGHPWLKNDGASKN